MSRAPLGVPSPSPRIRRAAAALGLLAVLGACRPAAPAAAPVAEAGSPPSTAAADTAAAPPIAAIETHWQCDDQRVAARFDPATRMLTLIHARGQLALPQATSASGARYADANGNEFRDTAGEARLTLSGTPARECRRVGNSTEG